MSESFNETTRRLLRAADDNGGLDEKTLFDLIVASHEETLTKWEGNAEAHAGIICRLDDHIKKERCTLSLIDNKLVELENKSLLVAEGFKGSTVSPDLADLLLSWKRLRWFLIITVGALVVMFADQIGHLIFGGAT